MVAEPILVLDDNPGHLKLIRFFLSREGYDLRSASDVASALAILEGFQPRVILVDLRLPGTDGLSLMRRLRADPGWRDVQMIAMTAATAETREKDARRAGADAYLSKPIDRVALRSTVAACLEAGRRIHHPPT